MNEVEVTGSSPNFAKPVLDAVLVKEGNKLIAEFMGATFRSYKDNRLPYYRFEEPIGETYAFKAMDLKYHSSWEWLMMVVDKIESLDKYCVIIRSASDDSHVHLCIIDNLFDDTAVCVSDRNSSKINAVWLTVIEFIKWHNQNAAIV